MKSRLGDPCGEVVVPVDAFPESHCLSASVNVFFGLTNQICLLQVGISMQHFFHVFRNIGFNPKRLLPIASREISIAGWRLQCSSDLSDVRFTKSLESFRSLGRLLNSLLSVVSNLALRHWCSGKAAEIDVLSVFR